VAIKKSRAPLGPVRKQKNGEGKREGTDRGKGGKFCPPSKVKVIQEASGKKRKKYTNGVGDDTTLCETTG